MVLEEEGYPLIRLKGSMNVDKKATKERKNHSHRKSDILLALLYSC